MRKIQQNVCEGSCETVGNSVPSFATYQMGDGGQFLLLFKPQTHRLELLGLLSCLIFITNHSSRKIRQDNRLKALRGHHAKGDLGALKLWQNRKRFKKGKKTHHSLRLTLDANESIM